MWFSLFQNTFPSTFLLTFYMQILKAATYKAINVTINYRLPELETATMYQQTHSCGLICHAKEHSRAHRKMEDTPSSLQCFETNLCISFLSNMCLNWWFLIWFVMLKYAELLEVLAKKWPCFRDPEFSWYSKTCWLSWRQITCTFQSSGMLHLDD